jgi:hypothetical protein
MLQMLACPALHLAANISLPHNQGHGTNLLEL